MTTTLLPRLVIDGAAEAIDFYTRAFGATESARFSGLTVGSATSSCVSTTSR